MNLTEKTLNGFFWMVSGAVVQAVLKIVVLAVLARLVSPTDFGLMGVATIILELSRVISKMVGGAALVQIKNIEDRHIRTGFTSTCILNGGLVLIVYLISPLLADFFEMSLLAAVLKAISIAFIFDSLTLVGQSLMERQLKFKYIASMEATSYALGFGLIGILLAYFEFGVWALVGAYLAQAAILMILILIIQPYSKGLGIDRNAFKELISFGGGMSIARIWNFIANQGDNLIIGKFLGLDVLGIYGRAYQIMVMPAKLIGTTMDKTLFPAMASIQNNKNAIANAYLAGIAVVSLIALPVGVTLIILADPLVDVFLGDGWEGVVQPLQILASCLLFRMNFKVSDSLVKSLGAVYQRAWRQMVFAFCVLLSTYIGHFWGISGVAFGVCFALFINFLLMAQISLSLTGLTWTNFIMSHYSGMILCVNTGVLGYFISLFCVYLNLSSFLILIVVSLGAGFPSLLLLNYLTKNSNNHKIREMRQMMLKKVNKK